MSARAPSASPPASPAAATVPIAGFVAFLATVPTELPALPAAEPIESPTPLSVPVTPLVDCREADEPALAPRDLLWRDRVEPEERFLLAPRLALDDVRRVRVGALLGELLRPEEFVLRAGERPLLRDVVAERPLLRVVAERPLGRDLVWAM